MNIISFIIRRLRTEFPLFRFTLRRAKFVWILRVDPSGYEFTITRFMSNLIRDLRPSNPHLTDEDLKEFIWEWVEEQILRFYI